MKTISAALVFLAAVSAPTAGWASGGEDASGAVRLEYAMSVGIDGKATSLTPSQELPAAIDQWIRQQIGRYTFAPATVNNEPQPATTTLYLSLGPAVGANGKQGYRLNAVETGPKLLRGRYDTPPREEGAGYFDITFDADGRVTKVKLDETQPFVGGPQFRRWARDLAKTFRLRPETVAGRAVPGSGTVPIRVCMDNICPELAPARDPEGNDLGGELVAKSVLSTTAPAGG